MVIRQKVFVVEQDCPYLDADGHDRGAIHVFSTNDQGEIVCYARILPPDLYFEGFSSIGRVVTLPEYREKGLGRQIMKYSLKHCRELFPDLSIKIMAQSYLVKFYRSFGFEVIGNEFLEDGIPHKYMILH